ncbi:MAG: hypothetical protein ED556_00315 [Winogradskyella sp.]|nr:MAG: hypothetical protein ED556_00315 [Winogradskyella sp.]
MTLCLQGQNSTLLQNINPRAKELKHSLNTTGDSILLSSDKMIYKVDIFNSEYEKSFSGNKYQLKIPLHDIPLGRFVVLAKLDAKLIAISLLRNRPYEEPRQALTMSRPSIESNPGKSSIQPVKIKKAIKGYWIVKIINGRLGSKRIRQMANKAEVEKFISVNEKEQNTRSGQHNKLTVWEVYNVDEFKKEIHSNKDYTKSISSVNFNVIPYYDTTVGRTSAL